MGMMMMMVMMMMMMDDDDDGDVDDDDDDDDGDDDIMLSTWLNRGSVVFNLGISIDRVLHDCCHSQLLGTGKTANGSAIIFLAERGFWGEFSSQGTYADVLADVLSKSTSTLFAMETIAPATGLSTTFYPLHG